MPNAAHYKPYDELAILAGREAGLDSLTPEAVAADEGARALRDKYWSEYERRLRDAQTYTLETIVEWMRSMGCTVSKSSVHRNQQMLRAQEEKVSMSARKARAVIEATSAAGVTDLLEANTMLSGQLIFDALSNLSADALSQMSEPQIIRLIEASGMLRKMAAETGLIKAREAELTATLRKATDAKAAKAGDGKLTREDVYALIDDAMKGNAA
jgi:hypothetical protein